MLICGDIKSLVYSAPTKISVLDFVVVVNDPESYAGSSIAIVRASNAKQVKGDGADKKGYPGPPGWVLSVGRVSLPHKYTFC